MYSRQQRRHGSNSAGSSQQGSIIDDDRSQDNRRSRTDNSYTSRSASGSIYADDGGFASIPNTSTSRPSPRAASSRRRQHTQGGQGDYDEQARRRRHDDGYASVDRYGPSGGGGHGGNNTSAQQAYISTNDYQSDIDLSLDDAESRAGGDPYGYGAAYAEVRSRGGAYGQTSAGPPPTDRYGAEDELHPYGTRPSYGRPSTDGYSSSHASQRASHGTRSSGSRGSSNSSSSSSSGVTGPVVRPRNRHRDSGYGEYRPPSSMERGLASLGAGSALWEYERANIRAVTDLFLRGGLVNEQEFFAPHVAPAPYSRSNTDSGFGSQ